jgi:hypothetical protein
MLLVCSKHGKTTYVYFNGGELELFQNIASAYNVDRSKLYSLFLSSLFFTKGKNPIPVKDFFSCFFSDIGDYDCNITLSKEICGLYSKINRLISLPSMTTIVRAAFFYYEHVAPDGFTVIKSPETSAACNSAGSAKLYFRGSLAFKNRLFDLKRSSGKNISCVAGSAVFQFLSSIRSLYDL